MITIRGRRVGSIIFIVDPAFVITHHTITILSPYYHHLCTTDHADIVTRAYKCAHFKLWRVTSASAQEIASSVRRLANIVLLNGTFDKAPSAG